MADPLELSCEKLAVAFLNQSEAVTAIIPSVRVFVQSDDSGPDGANAERIVCSARPREVELTGSNPTIVKVWRVFVDITIHFMGSAADLQSLIAAIHEAVDITPDAPALAIIAAAKIQYIDDTDEGEFNTADDERKRVKTFKFLAGA